MGLKGDIHSEAKTDSTGQFPPPNNREDMSLEIMVIGHFFLGGIPSLTNKMWYIEPPLFLYLELAQDPEMEIIPEASFNGENL